MSWEFEIPGPPVPKARARRGANGTWYTPKRTVEYEKEVYYLAKQAGLQFSEDRWYSLDITAHVYSFGRIGDRDNIVKSIMDGLRHFDDFDDRQFNSLAYRERGVDAPSSQYTHVRIEDNGPRGGWAKRVPSQGTLDV